MAGLVEEIQQMATDPSVRVSDLLLKVKLAASKLGLSDALEWVSLELGGYNNFKDPDMPSYRISQGRLMHNIPGVRAYPMGGDPATVAFYSMFSVKDPMSQIEELGVMYNGKPGRTLCKKLDIDLETMLRNSIGSDHGVFYVETDPAYLVSIASKVRELVLDWAIDLESKGVLGEGISFTVEEKSKAEQAAPITHITNHGIIHNGDVNGNQNRTMLNSTDNSTNSLDESSSFDNAITDVSNNITDINDRDTIIGIIHELKAQQGQKKGFMDKLAGLTGYAVKYGPTLAPHIGYWLTLAAAAV